MSIFVYFISFYLLPLAYWDFPPRFTQKSAGSWPSAMTCFSLLEIISARVLPISLSSPLQPYRKRAPCELRVYSSIIFNKDEIHKGWDGSSSRPLHTLSNTHLYLGSRIKCWSWEVPKVNYLTLQTLQMVPHSNIKVSWTKSLTTFISQKWNLCFSSWKIISNT